MAKDTLRIAVFSPLQTRYIIANGKWHSQDSSVQSAPNTVDHSKWQMADRITVDSPFQALFQTADGYVRTVGVLSGTPTILRFPYFPQAVQTICRIGSFLTNHSQFIIHRSPYHSTLHAGSLLTMSLLNHGNESLHTARRSVTRDSSSERCYFRLYLFCVRQTDKHPG